MKREFFLILFLTTVFYCSGNSSQIEKLKKDLSTAGEDSVKVNLLISLGRLFNDSLPQVAIKYNQEATDLSYKINYLKGAASALKNTGNIYYVQEKFIDALDYWQKAFDVYDSIGDNSGKCIILGNLGTTYWNMGDYVKANELYTKALSVSYESGDTLRIITMMKNTGAIFQNQEKTYENALNYYRMILPLLDKIKNSGDLRKKENAKYMFTITQADIGEVFLKMAKSTTDDAAIRSFADSALFHFNLSLPECNDVNRPGLLNKMGEAYMLRKEYKTAIAIQKESYEASRKLLYVFDTPLSLIGLAKAYRYDNNPAGAIKVLREAENVARELDSKYPLKEIYEELLVNYNTIHDCNNALVYGKLLIQYKDSIYNMEKEKKAQNFQFTLAEEKSNHNKLREKDKKIQEAQESKIRQEVRVRKALIAGFIILFILTAVIFKQRNRIFKEKKISDDLLLNILPYETAQELKTRGEAKAKNYAEVTVMFTDFLNFTKISEAMSAEELIREMNYCYSEFDRIIAKYGIEKIKTIGDSYMCASGLPVENTTNAVDMINAAREIVKMMDEYNERRRKESRPVFETRIGIHTGPVIAGIVGIKKFAYDIWGDTVNTASRMESNGAAGKINISDSTYQHVKDIFTCVYRGKIAVKNKGMTDMYFVETGA